MDERVLQFRVGVVVLAALMITLFLIVLFSEWPAISQGYYTIYISFEDAPVAPDTPIRKSGLLIGRVTKVELRDEAGALVAAQIRKDVILRRNDVPRISGSLIGGDTTIRFVRRSDPRLSNAPLKPGDLVVGQSSTDPVEVIGSLEGRLADALVSVDRAAIEIGTLANRLSGVLENKDEQIARIIDKTERTLDSMQGAMSGVDELLGDPEMRERLKQSLKELPDVLRDARDTLGRLQHTTELADRNLENLQGFTQPLGEKGDRLVAKIDEGFTKLNYVLDEVGKFSAALNDSEGSLGQLVNNPDLYQNLDRAAANLNQLTRQLRPVADDLRVFTDNLARHPGGPIRDAIAPGPGTKFR